jgi:hypothetical protein
MALLIGKLPGCTIGAAFILPTNCAKTIFCSAAICGALRAHGALDSSLVYLCFTCGSEAVDLRGARVTHDAVSDAIMTLRDAADGSVRIGCVFMVWSGPSTILAWFSMLSFYGISRSPAHVCHARE